MRCVTSIIFLSALTPLAFAASALIDNLPPELAARMQIPTGGAALILDPPENFPAFDYPPEVAVLGSIDEEFAGTVVLGEVTSDAHARVEQVLLDAGWKHLPSPVSPRDSGFIGAPRRERPSLYCHDIEMGRLSLDRASNQGERYLLLGRQTGSAFVRGVSDQLSCQEQIERSQQRAQARGETLGTYMPRLELPGLDDPATAPQMHSSSNGGGQNDQHASALITAAFTSAELSAHLGGQLSAQGWTLVGDIDASYLLTSNWTRELDDGSLLLGVLSIVDMGDNKFDVYFRLVLRSAGN